MYSLEVHSQKGRWYYFDSRSGMHLTAEGKERGWGCDEGLLKAG